MRQPKPGDVLSGFSWWNKNWWNHPLYHGIRNGTLVGNILETQGFFCPRGMDFADACVV